MTTVFALGNTLPLPDPRRRSSVTARPIPGRVSVFEGPLSLSHSSPGSDLEGGQIWEDRQEHDSTGGPTGATDSHRGNKATGPFGHLEAPDDDISIHSYFVDSFPLIGSDGELVQKKDVRSILSQIVSSLSASPEPDSPHLLALGKFYSSSSLHPKPKRYQNLLAASCLQMYLDANKVIGEGQGEENDNDKEREDKDSYDAKGSGVEKDGDFYLRLGRSHFNIWREDGIVASPKRLELAVSALRTSVKILSDKIDSETGHGRHPGPVTSNDDSSLLESLELLCCSLLYLGDVSGGKDVILTIIKTYPTHPNLPSIYILLSSVLTKLSLYDKAATCLKTVLKSGPETYCVSTAYSTSDILTLLGRIYELTSEDDADDFKPEQIDSMEKQEIKMEERSKNRYRQAYESLRRELEEEGVDVPSTGDYTSNHTTFNGWILDPATWNKLAEKCLLAGNYLFAVDCLEQCIEKGGGNSDIWWRLGKTAWRCGKTGEALVAGKRAVWMAEEEEELREDVMDNVTGTANQEQIGELEREKREREIGRDRIYKAVECWGESKEWDRGDKPLTSVQQILFLVNEVEETEGWNPKRAEEEPLLDSDQTLPELSDEVGKGDDEGCFWPDNSGVGTQREGGGAQSKRVLLVESEGGSSSINSRTSGAGSANSEEAVIVGMRGEASRSPNEQLPMLQQHHPSHHHHHNYNHRSTSPQSQMGFSLSGFSTLTKRTQSSRISSIVSSQIAERGREKALLEDYTKRKLLKTREKTILDARSTNQVKEEPKLPLWKAKQREINERERARKNGPAKNKKIIRNKLKELRRAQLPDPTCFEPSFRSNSHFFKKNSVETFKKLGYTSNQTLVYWDHWTSKLKSLRSQMLSQLELNQCIATIRSHYPFVSKEAVFVALAEAQGSIEEATAKLSEEEFLRECDVICRVINVGKFIKIEGVGGLFLDREEGVVDADGFSLVSSLDNGSSIGVRGEGSVREELYEGDYTEVDRDLGSGRDPSGKCDGDESSTSSVSHDLPRKEVEKIIQRQREQSSPPPRTFASQTSFMKSLATPESSKSPVDIMVECHIRENFVSPVHTVRLNSIINSGSGEWGPQKGGRIAGGKGGGFRRQKHKLTI